MSPIWEARAALFEKPRGVGIVKLCARGLHDLYEGGTRTHRQTIAGRVYTHEVCRLCANAASRASNAKRRAA